MKERKFALVKKDDVVVIGAGISGLTAAALLAKRGLHVYVIDSQYKPGGSCGIFKRKDIIFEQGAAMLYGFGDRGFNPHRFVFDVLDEPIDMIKHDNLYAINFNGHRIIFYDDMDKFIEELSEVFPKEKDGFKRFYKDISSLYLKVIAENPVYSSPDAVEGKDGLKSVLKHPLSYMKMVLYMNKSTEDMLKKYFKSREVFEFFDKLTSTYCYTNVKETPAVLSAIMFADNHFGGSYYPAGSTLNFIGKLEKVIEENGGDMIYGREAVRILIKDNAVKGVLLDNGRVIESSIVVNSGTVWNLYENLLKGEEAKKKREWAESLEATYASLVFYALVRKEAIPEGTMPIEMLINDTSKIDEGEVTVYIMSIDDKTLCPEGFHTVTCVGPSFKKWPHGFKTSYNDEEYEKMKESEKLRIIELLEKRFKGFKENIVYCEMATPSTLERYVMKHNGAVAGPKQKIGQHMLNRLKIKEGITGLYNCGESTAMGTGTPAVTVSGISAANLILRDMGMEEYKYERERKKCVNIVPKPYIRKSKKVMGVKEKLKEMSEKCQYCEEPDCQKACPWSVPIRDITRRLSIGNFYGADKALGSFVDVPCMICDNPVCEKKCYRGTFDDPVSIQKIMKSMNSIKNIARQI